MPAALTADQIANIVQVWNASVSVKAAAKELGRSPGSLRQAILRMRQAGVPGIVDKNWKRIATARARKEAAKADDILLRAQERLVIVDAWNTLTSWEAAEHLGLSVSALRSRVCRLRKLGIPVRRQPIGASMRAAKAVKLGDRPVA